MSFKLLAIRPLEGTDPSLLKGLKPNCIYRFYNEYDYLYDYDENTGIGKSFIDLQDLFFQTIAARREEILHSLKNNIAELNNVEDIRNCLKKTIEDVFKHEYFKRFIKEKKDTVDNVLVNASTIELFKKDALSFFNNRILTTPKSNCVAIKYNQQIPDGFFGENINVSAIVGENGSGKSSLLEFYYYFLYYYSFFKEILNNIDAVQYHGINCHIELYYEYYNEIIKVFFKPGQSDITPAVHYIIKNNVFVVDSSNVDSTEREFFKKSFTLYKKDLYKKIANLPTYNIALNYGVYGLNSSIEGYGWLKPLFHKNDGYQTPIVINPMRINGNIDINTENRLLTQRLVLNHFVIGNKKLLSNISFKEARYSLEVYKYQFYNYIIDEENTIFINNKKLPKHVNKIDVKTEDGSEFEYTFNDNNLVLKWFKLFLKENYKEEMDEFSALQTFLREIGKYSKELDFRVVFGFWKENVEKNDRFVLNRDKGTLTIAEIQYLNLLYIYNKLYKMTLYYSEYNRFKYLFAFVDQKKLDIEIKEQVSQLSLVLGKENNLHSDEVVDAVYKMYESIEQLGNPIITVNKNIRIQNIKEDILKNLKFEDTKTFTEEIVNLVINSINQSRTDDLGRFIERVMNQDTHIEFKIHQAISYFESNTFESLIDVGKSTFNERSGYYDLHIKEGYFTNGKGEPKVFDINKVPMAFFNLEVLVQKHTEQDIYNFKTLSSGEQQMINGVLTIVYHLYNIQSVHNTNYNKIKYYIVNILLDEIELYFHPDYQRRFVEELLTVLKGLNTHSGFQEFMYNVMMVTHSPFILSDIPSQNVLKLKDGKPVVGDSINSFGANIHDLLADEFFLDKGFMGEFAKEKINSLIKFLQVKILRNREANSTNDKEKKKLNEEIKAIGEIAEYKKDTCKQIISQIGEPMLNISLENLYKEVFSTDTKIEDIEEEIIRLRKRKKELLNKS